jgi:hypothetical protein
MEKKNMTKKNEENFKFAWRVIAALTIAYFIAALFSMKLFSQN